MLIFGEFPALFCVPLRADLDDHCPGVLHIRVGVLSLARLALEVVREVVEGGLEGGLEGLPKHLRDLVKGNGGEEEGGEEGEEQQYSRGRLHAGI